MTIRAVRGSRTRARGRVSWGLRREADAAKDETQQPRRAARNGARSHAGYRTARSRPYRRPLTVESKIERARARSYGDRFIDALAYTARIHASQHDSGDGQPYIGHLLRVTGLVIEDGGSENEAIAALLHDAAEDQGGMARLAEIRRRYGEEVARIVNECTDSYLDDKPPWRGRKQLYVEHLDDSTSAALRVSLADKVDNARTIVRDYRSQGEDLWSRTGKPGEDVRWYYDALGRRFSELRPGPLADELRHTVRELDRLLVERGRSPVGYS